MVNSLLEIVMTVLDYEMKVIARDILVLALIHTQMAIKLRLGSGDNITERFTTMMGHFGQVTGVVSLCFSLIGTPLLLKHLGAKGFGIVQLDSY
jgi:hypothetical protein